MQSKTSGAYFGKYRELILAIAFFLVFDLAVLVLNFYISFQISEDALAINLAGRQRMLSQRMTKALLSAQSNLQRGLPNTDALAEITKTVELFDATLTGFQHGAMVAGGDGKQIFLTPVTTPEERAILASADAIWQPYKAMLAPLTSANGGTPEKFERADSYARANNLQLLALMNNLTTQLEQTANSKAEILRKVQTGGILLALLNFAFILFRFIGRLRKNDREVELAQKETAKILGTVKEGLFLLDPAFRIGSQFSHALSKILGRDVEAGADFRALLRDMVPAPTFALACDYIGLLLGDGVKGTLIGDLNPLTGIEVAVPGENGSTTRRFLSLQFNRVKENGKLSHLLVTVVDVTVQAELERALAEAREKTRAEIEIMLDLLKIRPATLDLFLKTAELTLLEINEHLRPGDSAVDYRRTVNTIFRKIHALRGEAAALGLDMFEHLAQQFETLLSGLRGKEAVSGDDLHALPFPLEEFLQRVTMVRDLTSRLAGCHDTFTPLTDSDAFAQNLSNLAQQVAQDHGKEVQLTTDLDLFDTLPQKTRNGLQDIAIQLLHNAVAHGIEPALERQGHAKPATGNIYVALKPSEEGAYELTLRDDGRGLSPQDIRHALLRSGRYTDAHLSQLDDHQIVMKIFEPGFSTAQNISRDAGHGVGMDVVKHRIEQLGARLRISTRTNAFTQFSIHFVT